jgi:hypothetical protein
MTCQLGPLLSPLARSAYRPRGGALGRIQPARFDKVRRIDYVNGMILSILHIATLIPTPRSIDG